MIEYLRYMGSDYILGEVVGESKDGFYWLVHKKPTKEDPSDRIVCHPKWCTEKLNEFSKEL